jgi:hypothetical protein
MRHAIRRDRQDVAGTLTLLFERRRDSVTEPAIDRDAMGRLAKALAFICGADHPTTVALRTAAETGTEKDIKAARALFLRLTPNERKSALAMLQDD